MHSARELRSSLGHHGMLDVWPARKEVVLAPEPQSILEAIDDRAITRLLVEDGPPGELAFEPEALASARGRIESCLAYSPSGRAAGADVRIASNAVTEGYVEAILDPDGRLARLRAEGGNGALVAAIERRMGEVEPKARGRLLAGRAALVEDGRPVETYRRLGLDEALALVAAAGQRQQWRGRRSPLGV